MTAHARASSPTPARALPTTRAERGRMPHGRTWSSLLSSPESPSTTAVEIEVEIDVEVEVEDDAAEA